MDLLGIPKQTYRSRVMVAYKAMTGLRALQTKHLIVTLGGPIGENGKVILGSEYNQFLLEGFVKPIQYVSIERDRWVHANNSSIVGPNWVHGDLAKVLRHAAENTSSRTLPIGILHADMMSGVRKAMPDITSMLESLASLKKFRPHNTLFVLNLIEANRWRANQGATFDNVHDTVMKNWQVRSHLRNGMELIDRHSYENKTVGTGRGITKLTTLMFWY